MKPTLLLTFLNLITWGASAWARVDSITIKKTHSHRRDSRTMPEFQIIKDSQDIEGDPSSSDAEARKNWKKACDEWKSEIKGLNKANEVMSLNCGKSSLSKTESGQKLYHSVGTTQIKTRIRSQPQTPASADSAANTDDDDEEDDGDEEGENSSP